MYKILLVEDDSAIRFIYSKMKVWTECGFQIDEMAPNGKDALELLSKKQFDLIVTDIRMPFIDGIELLREIKKRRIDICVIFISSYDEFEYARQGLILGAFDYILKPIKEKQLKEVLERTRKYLSEKSNEPVIEASVSDVFMRIGADSENDNFVHKVGIFFSENYGKIITMDDIALYFNFNKDYFGKIFKNHFGITFNYFYSLIKIEYAKELIKTGNYKNYQISEMLGYSSTDYFTKIFREITGETPTAYKSKIDNK